MTARPQATYRWRGVALLRASTDPGALDLPEDLDVFGQDRVQDGLVWLSALWQRENVRAALAAASPALSGRVDELVTAGSRDGRRVGRAVLSMASYLVRWQRRATPFGLFSGVGVARIGTGATVRFGGEHRVSLRADAAWLGDVVARLHECPQLRERLSVVVHNAGCVRGDRFVAPGSSPEGIDAELAPVEVSVRASRAVRAALDAARHPIPFGALRRQLAQQFPAAAEAQIDDMLTGLIDQGLLIGSLRAPMTVLDALGHVCRELESVDAHTIPGVQGIVWELSAIHHELSTDHPATVSRSALTQRMRALSTAGPTTPLVVDTILDADVVIPEQVAREACDAVRVLYRLSAYPWGSSSWRDYVARFRARYGTGAFVPVLDLVADSGLGFPAGYLGSSWGRAARKVSERDEKLLALIQRATVEGAGEIVLTDQVIADLTAGDRTDLQLPARCEVAVEIRSPSWEALARGRFALTVTGTPRPGSSMIGRHAHLLPEHDRDLIAESFAAAGPDAVAAQLSFAARKRRNDNVARTEQFLPHVIPVAEHRPPSEQLIELSDLAVTADEHRLALVQVSTGRRVEPRVTHALEAGTHTPPLARFLAEITTGRAAVYRAFDVGAAAKLPYLPRIRYRRTTLSAARWLLTTGDLPEREASNAEWETGLRSWRRRWGVPEHVAIVDHDRRQPVDLSHGLHRLLLRTRLDRAGRLELRETAAPAELAWLGRAHDIVVPLVLDAAEDTAPAAASTSQSTRVVAVDAGHLPGNSTIVCAHLYGHPGRFDDLLTERVPALMDAFGDPAPAWWFRRHRELRRPEVDQYLAVYLRLRQPSAYGDAAEHLATWSAMLRRDRLLSHVVLATHEPQPGRYGHGLALQRAQDVFAADSAAALTQITLARRAGVPSHAVAAASMVDLVVSFTGSTPAGLDWLLHQPQEHGRLDPTLRGHALELADPHRTGTPLQSLPGGNDVLAAWHTRATALAAYRETLARQRDPLTVLRCLLHSHHIRAVGVDPDAERITTRLARTCALRHTARP